MTPSFKPRNNRYKHIRSRYLPLNKTPTYQINSDNTSSDGKNLKEMSIKELCDEIYRVAIKKREDVIFDLHKEICTKYEDILKDNYKTITDLQEQTKSMEDKIKNDKHIIDDLVEDSENQITELENKLKTSIKQYPNYIRQMILLISKTIYLQNA
uniref:Uncharacterized protein n=1 Tax=Cacopsylla melanoneura TaxID=428564 RepID=A0A8D8RDQ6_9HEMI